MEHEAVEASLVINSRHVFVTGMNIFLYLIFTVNCSPTRTNGSEIVKNKNDKTMDTIEIKADFKGQQLLRPPQLELLFDYHLKNETSSPLWFLLPYRIDNDFTDNSGGTGGFEIFRLNDKGILGRFIGSKSFYAILLAPNTGITLQNFPVKSVGEIDDSKALLTFLTTPELSINNTDMYAVFNNQELENRNGTLDYSNKKMVYSKFIEDLNEMPVEWKFAKKHSLEVSLK